MKTFFRTFSVLLLVGILLFHAAIAQQFNANLAAKLQQTLDTQLAAFPITKGVSASVYYPGQGLWQGASGLSYAGHPITTDMEFAIASNSKLFTAVAVMKLVENNVLSLNDQLKKWLPTYANVDSSITIRQLLNHRSGLADVFNAASMAYIVAHPDHNFTTAEVMAYVGPKLFKAGTSFSYSNTNYVLAGMIVESATGIPISKIIRDSILTPLNLDSTFYDGKETVLGTIAHPWENGVDVSNVSRTALNTLGTSAGSMYSTSGEMAQWYQALLSGQVVSASSLQEITNFVSPGNYGFGIMTMQLFGRTVWSHGGTNTGYNSRMMYDTELKATVCGLGNANPSAIDGTIVGVLLKTLVDALPATAGVITGTTTVCQGQSSVTYTVPAIAKASSYTWTLPNGATGTSSTNSITVDYGVAAQSGTITVAGTNMYGNGVTSSLAVTVQQVPTVVLSGATDVAVNSSKQYSIQQLQGSITWSILGGVITSGQGTSAITVNWGAAGAGNLGVSVLLASGCTATQSLAVTKHEAATGASLALWFDASHIPGAMNSQVLPFTAPYNESHPSWPDISGNGRGAYMMGGNSLLIPTYFDNGLNTVNDLPAVRFDQINDALLVNNSAGVNAGNAKSLLAVFKTGADITADQVVFESGGGTSTSSGFTIYISKGDIGFGVWNGSQALWIHKPCAPNTVYLTQLVYDGAAGTMNVTVNTNSATAGGAPLTLLQGTQYNGVGSSVNGTKLRTKFSTATIDFPFGGSIAEVVLYNSVTPSIRNQTFAYLNAKYSLSLAGNPKIGESGFEIFEGNSELNSDGATAIVPLSIQPNPATDEATIRIHSTMSDEVEISVYDMLGRRFILPVKGIIDIGWNELRLPTTGLPTGTYRVVLSGAGIHESTSFVILK
ncbi:MAG: serine hydrolase [Candidatus Kapaibacterium sp.]